LVLAGGVDGAELEPLRRALEATRLADYPRDVLVWAGADAPDVVAALPAHRAAANVLDTRLRPHLPGLAEAVRDIYLRDLIDRKGLQALADVTDVQIWPTPAVTGLAAARMTTHRILPGSTSPFVIVDIGGATTDVFICAELRREHTARSAPGESIVRHIFTDLGVAASLSSLRQQLADDPDLLDLVSTVDPARARARYAAICEDAPGALSPPADFLACLFLALRRLTHSADLGRAATLVITGGAWGGAAMPAVRRVVDLACATSGTAGRVLMDHGYHLWAHGIQEVPRKAGR
jgi:hypothetical protein